MDYKNIEAVRELTKQANMDKELFQSALEDINEGILHFASKGRGHRVFRPNPDTNIGRVLSLGNDNLIDKIINHLRTLGYEIATAKLPPKQVALSVTWDDSQQANQ